MIDTKEHPGSVALADDLKVEPAWDVALLYPPQGAWTEEDYFALPADGRRVELVDGRIEVLPMPTEMHQFVAAFLYDSLKAFVKARRLGVVLFAGLCVRMRQDNIRQPDVVFLRKENYHRRGQQFWEGADLAMEVVSEDRKRDLETKREEYARAGISEYWVVDPRDERITVLALDGTTYRVHGEFVPGQEATSALLPGFSVSVDAVFAAADE